MFSVLFIIWCIYIALDNVCKCIEGLEENQYYITVKFNSLEKEIYSLKSVK